MKDALDNPRTPFAILAIMGALLSIPSALTAQQTQEGLWERPLMDVQVRAGVSTPAEEYTRYATPGYYTGLALAYWLNQGLAVRADISLHSLDGAQTRDPLTRMPDQRLWFGGLGVEYDWTHRRETRLNFNTNLGVGATHLNTDFFTGPGGEATDVSETFLTFTVGVDLGWPLTENIRFVVGSKAFIGAVDEDALVELAAVNAAADPISTLLTFGTSAGLRIDLPN